VTVRTALLQGAEILQKAAIAAPRLTAEVLLGHAMHCDRAYLYAHGEDELTQLAWIHYGRYLNERLKGKPTQYITHRQEFYGRDFYVSPDVLIPRPETEHLVEAALAWLRDHPGSTILDVGTGSGAIAISIALESGRFVLASDISLSALAVAERNRKIYGAPVAFFAADLLDSVQPRSIDLLLSNPPYVPGVDRANMQAEVRDWEPHLALFAGDTGFEIYRRLIAGAEIALKPGGRLMMELGYQSLDGVREMLAARWTGIEVVSDLAGWPRVIGASCNA
jgi:release factor glutamine methyltransferase